MPRTLLSAHELTLAHGPRTLLSRATLAVDDTSTIALVGPNGCGKSTLLRLLAGEQPPDGGRVIRARGVVVLRLPQLDEVRADTTVRGLLHERLGVAAAAARLDVLERALAGGADVALEHADALEAWLARGGADVDARLDAAAAEAALEPALLDRPPAALSGGQRARAMLAALTAARADVLLLDEPANHLDDDGLHRLRSRLNARRGGVVLVAHDRSLLAATSDRVAELDPHDGTLAEFAGGWAAYEAERSRARHRALAAHTAALAERERLTALERAARARGPVVERRLSGEPDRNIRHARRQSAQRSADGIAAGFARRAARIEVPDRPWEVRPTHLRHAAGDSRAGVIAALTDAVLRRGDFTVGPVTLELRDGDRLRLVGPNGCGKSTLLAALAGRLEPVRGSITRAPAPAIAEIAQQRSGLLGGDHPDLVSAARSAAALGEREARAALAAMGLEKQLVGRPVGSLSPGERTRAELAVATAAGARLLLLDEPTNHLDVAALEALEAALAGWPGALVLTTHDNRLVDGLALDAELDVAALSRRR